MGRIVFAAVVLAVGALAQAPTGGLTGAVVDQLGARIAGAEIVVAGLSLREVTDLRGEFHIAGLESGPYRLTVTFPGFLLEQVYGRVEANRTTAIDEIQMKAGTSRNVGCQQWEQPQPTVVVRKREHRNHGVLIAGTVRAWGKSSLASAIVKVRSTAAPDSPVVVNTDQNGGFEITGLRPGTYVLTVESRDYDPVMILQITLHDGFEARIDDIQLGSRFTICN